MCTVCFKITITTRLPDSHDDPLACKIVETFWKALLASSINSSGISPSISLLPKVADT